VPLDSNSDWEGDPNSPQESEGPGILSGTLKNVAVLAAMCVVILIMVNMSGIGEMMERDPVRQRENLVQQNQAAAVPQPAPRAARAPDWEYSIQADDSGHFLVDAEVDGETIRFLVDTGASVVALTPEDAERIGLHRSNLDFSQEAQTANGVVRTAPVMLRNILVGPIDMNDVRGSVHESALSISLLGMSFLSRLESYEVRDGEMVMAQ
jgi:aspartyl protease family protein